MNRHTIAKVLSYRNPIMLSILINFFNILGGMLLVFMNQSWLKESNIYKIDKTPLNVSVISVLSFIFSSIILMLFMRDPNRYLFHANTYTTIPTALLELYYGVKWLINPRSYFTKLAAYWTDPSMAKCVIQIQRKIHCCGFFISGDHTFEKCMHLPHSPCLEQMLNLYGLNISGAGTLLLAHVLSHFAVAILFFLVAKNVLKINKTEKETV